MKNQNKVKQSKIIIKQESRWAHGTADKSQLNYEWTDGTHCRVMN